MKKLFNFLGAVALVCSMMGSVFVASWAEDTQEDVELNFVQWSDTHWGEEHTSRAVLEKTINDGLKERDVDFYIFAGDCVDNKKADKKIFQNRVDEFCKDYLQRMVDSKKPVLFTYGNNDFYKNYNTEPGNMRPTMEAVAKTFGKEYYLDELGNGVYPEKIKGTTWICMNSLIFSRKNSCPEDILSKQRLNTLNWLESNLQKVPAQSTAVILCHVPPCIDAYDDKPQWDSDSMNRFHQILAESKCQAVIVSGHTHRSELHYFKINKDKSVPLIISGAISEKYNYVANYRFNKWIFDREDGKPELFMWEIRYPEHPKYNVMSLIDEPTETETWEDFRESLKDNPLDYFSYMMDFYAHMPGIIKITANNEFMNKILSTVNIYTDYNGMTLENDEELQELLHEPAFMNFKEKVKLWKMRDEIEAEDEDEAA